MADAALFRRELVFAQTQDAVHAAFHTGNPLHLLEVVLKNDDYALPTSDDQLAQRLGEAWELVRTERMYQEMRAREIQDGFDVAEENLVESAAPARKSPRKPWEYNQRLEAFGAALESMEGKLLSGHWGGAAIEREILEAYGIRNLILYKDRNTGRLIKVSLWDAEAYRVRAAFRSLLKRYQRYMKEKEAAGSL